MIVAGTGHRPNKLPAGDAKLREFAKIVLMNHKPDKVISGMALGWDMALAEAASDLGIPFVAAVPFKGQESVWSARDRERYAALLVAAAEVVYVCEPGYAVWKYQRRNEWMSDRCDVLLALWNGTSGGTANCVRYAEKKGRTIVNVWPEFEAWAKRA